VRRLLSSRRTGLLTKQPRWWRGRADSVKYDASGGCQAPPDSAAPCCIGDDPSPRASHEGERPDFASPLSGRLTRTPPVRARPVPIERGAGPVSYDVPVFSWAVCVR